MEPNLFKYIWRHSKGEQVVILLLVLISMPFYFVSLDLPKSIINKGIQGQGFDGPGSTLPFLRFELPYGEALFGEAVEVRAAAADESRSCRARSRAISLVAPGSSR